MPLKNYSIWRRSFFVTSVSRFRDLLIVVTWLAVIAFSMIFTWFYNNTISLPIVMLLHAALNSFDDVYENIFPSLVNIDWELPYIAGILLLGIAFAFVLKRNKTLTNTTIA